MSELAGAIEALLFVSDEPLSASEMAKLLEQETPQIEAVLAELSERWESEERGIQLREVAGGWRLYTHPAYHELIEGYVLSWDTRSLSQAALEALAVVAYHQPTTRAMVNSIRGVNSEGVISSLVEKGLLREAGRDTAAGNAILYATSRTFLEKFGLKNLNDLPPLEDFAPDEESREFIRSRLSAGRSENQDQAEGAHEGEGAQGETAEEPDDEESKWQVSDDSMLASYDENETAGSDASEDGVGESYEDTLVEEPDDSHDKDSDDLEFVD